VEPAFKVPDRPSKLDAFAEKLSAWLQLESRRIPSSTPATPHKQSPDGSGMALLNVPSICATPSPNETNDSQSGAPSCRFRPHP
jgi:hypothetical protein